MLYGEHIRLRPIERDDLARFQRWLADPEVRVRLGRHLPVSTAQQERWYEETLSRSADEQPWSIDAHVPASDWAHIGSTGLFDLSWRNRSAELGILIGEKSYWNRGLGTDATRTLLRHAFDTLNLHRVHLRVFDGNKRAQRSYEKAGFVLEGRMRDAEFREGRYLDVLIYGALRDDAKLGPAGTIPPDS